MRYTKRFLNKLENISSEADYILRYEKGNFQSGYCLLKNSKVVVINNFLPLDGKVQVLMDVLAQIATDPEKLSEPAKKILDKLFKEKAIKVVINDLEK